MQASELCPPPIVHNQSNNLAQRAPMAKPRTPRRLSPIVKYLLLVVAATLRVTATRTELETGVVAERKAAPALPDRPISPPQRRIELRSLLQAKTWWNLISETASNWSNHKAGRLGAALAYYSVFSIGPLILIVIAVAGLVFGHDAVRGEVSSELTGLLGQEGSKSIEAMLAGASQPREGLFATIIGIVTLLFAAIGVVVQLKDALNTVWEVSAKSQSGVWSFVRSYAVSLAGILALGFLLLVSLLVSAALSAAGKIFAAYFPEAIFQVITAAVSFGVISLLFAMMFKWLPDTWVDWGDVWLGAFVTAALFELGKLLIGLYIGKVGLESTFGAAASIVVILLWVYYSAQIVLFGAEFTRVYSLRRRAST